MFVGGGDGNAKTELTGGGGHRRDQQQRVVDRRLRGGSQRSVRFALVDVNLPQRVGNKHRIESGVIQQARNVQPVVERGVLAGAVVGVSPQPGGDVADDVHHKAIE